jgi:hypothetical protein
MPPTTRGSPEARSRRVANSIGRVALQVRVRTRSAFPARVPPTPWASPFGAAGVGCCRVASLAMRLRSAPTQTARSPVPSPDSIETSRTSDAPHDESVAIKARAVARARRWAIAAFGFGVAAALLAFLVAIRSIGWSRAIEERGLLYASLPVLCVVGPMLLWVGVRVIEGGVDIIFFRPFFGRQQSAESPEETDADNS